MVGAKTGYIHILETEGKLFLKWASDLVLTVLDDYGSKCCLVLAVCSPAFFQGFIF